MRKVIVSHDVVFYEFDFSIRRLLHPNSNNVNEDSAKTMITLDFSCQLALDDDEVSSAPDPQMEPPNDIFPMIVSNSLLLDSTPISITDDSSLSASSRALSTSSPDLVVSSPTDAFDESDYVDSRPSFTIIWSGPITRVAHWITKPNPRYALSIAASTIEVPKSAKKALDIPKWHEAMRLEYEAMIHNNTWTLVPKYVGDNIIGSLWLFKLKQKIGWFI